MSSNANQSHACYLCSRCAQRYVAQAPVTRLCQLLYRTGRCGGELRWIGPARDAKIAR